MSHSHIWYETKLPKEIINILHKDVKSFDNQLKKSKVIGSNSFRHYQLGNKLDDNSFRSGKNTWIPDNHWIGGFLWHYINLSNQTNFLYDITNIDHHSIQYSEYKVGDFYKWHQDSNILDSYIPKNPRSLEGSVAEDNIIISGESSRKLSFSMQLSDEDEYEGGELQLMDSSGHLYTTSKERGVIVIFDSRLVHRVRKVKSGCRRSLVGWAVGPRWR
jgi:PKHD-type hydroxylase